PITPQRVIDPTTATAEVHLATGVFVDEWRARPDAIEVATFDPRSPAERDEFDRLHAELIGELTRLGLTDLIETVDGNLFGVQVDSRIPEHLQATVRHMLELGVESAVFIAPPPEF
ncbi:MAG TPA: hypothetical protein PLV68_12170, partial [Ilumatobacteraceae bacterium]|nr:hypothetical protein [Ilumatobacteraceae bacterium]